MLGARVGPVEHRWHVLLKEEWRTVDACLAQLRGEEEKKSTAYTYGVVLMSTYIGATVTILVRTNSPGAKEMDTE